MVKAAGVKKRRIVSSDEDEPKASPQKKTNGTKAPAKTPDKKELKSVDVFGALGSGPVKRVERQKKAKASEKDLFNDSIADDLVLMDVEDSVLDGQKSQESPNTNNNNLAKEGTTVKEKGSPTKEKDAKSSKAGVTKAKPESPQKIEQKIKHESRSPHKSSSNGDKPSGSSRSSQKEFKEPKIEKKLPDDGHKSNGKERDKSTESSGTPSQSKVSGSRPSSSKKEKKEPAAEENLDYSCNFIELFSRNYSHFNSISNCIKQIWIQTKRKARENERLQCYTSNFRSELGRPIREANQFQR